MPNVTNCETLAEMTDAQVLEVWSAVRLTKAVQRSQKFWRQCVIDELADRGFRVHWMSA